ncbi:1-(5-phosphoribosyl)-5-[(5-phosphoribosylamino)methylideneamino]imidazole-4-carboxamide isomerase [Candidatus Margulisiibacteriota bacterium]
MFEVIPAIDILNGKVVRLTKGDYDQVDHYPFTPAELACEYERAGARRIHLVDLDGARSGELVNLESVKQIRKAVSCKLEYGGGLRSKEKIERLFSIGINYLILGSFLIKEPQLAYSYIKEFPNKIIAGLDAKNGLVAVEGWKETSTVNVREIISKLNDYPLESIIYTDISRDGTLAGPNIPGLKQVCAKSNIPVIASGGISSLRDIEKVAELEKMGVMGCITGKALLAGKIQLQDIAEKYWAENKFSN